MANKNVYIPILFRKNTNPFELKEICAGLEEEGVPYILKEMKRVEHAPPSSLHVKIMMDEHSNKICHDKLAEKNPYMEEKKGLERSIGKNAARLVKGLPMVMEKGRK
ncbi:glycerol dehydratase reactivase beta/small subunit family protein [Alteribacillus sp. YIM 98480]|uniref:glycerol dehydratase reactivase beta/small subunit family protein n=1 Tax=Alteribacillus sp. YIM 98480 TaxID=2606599 RepID=UPI00131E86AB|nr:glycerol dehydratase reactivase beta/small subunit family protein [Alteribacillus sp. YIM 98480]